jgi:hypothetical protein
MSATLSANDPWKPLHHADAASPAWKPKVVTDKKPDNSEGGPNEPVKKSKAIGAEPEADDSATKMQARLTVSSPMDVQLMVPAKLVQEMAALAAAQRELSDQVAALVTKLADWTGDVHATMHTAQQPVIEAMQTTQAKVIDGQRVLSDQVKALAEAQPALMRSIGTWSQNIEAAIRAPRHVNLERGADGLATGAVSTVVSPRRSPS